jgi:hypothetical protein
MFGLKKKKPKSSVAERIEKEELTIAAGQSLLDIRKLEAQVNDFEHATRDHSNLVDLRSTWGKVILGILITTIISDFTLIVMVGSGIWKFENNAYFLNVIVTEHLVQIFGLVIIVLKSLFPDTTKTKKE